MAQVEKKHFRVKLLKEIKDENSAGKSKVQKVVKKTVPVKKSEIIDGYTIKYHANGKTRWSKGKIVNGQTEGYWEWYRLDGTLKRSGYFDKGEPVGEWTTYDENGNVYKVERKKVVNKTNNNEGIYCPVEAPETSNSTKLNGFAKSTHQGGCPRGKAHIIG